MLSICIPIYNIDCSELITTIKKQALILNIEYEIILIDDDSTVFINDELKSYYNQYKFIQLNKNIGRSKIRNLFLQYTQYENLLFLDCDASINNNLFLNNYITFIQNNHYNIVCGGRIFKNQKPPKNKLLRWKYGKYIESKNALERNQNPNNSFMTNNFIIKKEILVQFPFDETIVTYGHEDTLMGFQLKEKNIKINHIDNTVVNNDEEENDSYLIKTNESVKNLALILSKEKINPLFHKEIKLLNAFNLLKTNKLLSIFKIIFRINKPFVQYLLKKGFSSLSLFSYYKLGVFCTINKQEIE